MAAVSLFWNTTTPYRHVKTLYRRLYGPFPSCLKPLFQSEVRGEAIDVIDMKMTIYSRALGVPLGILGGGVSPGSPNPDPVSDQKIKFSTPVFTLDV